MHGILVKSENNINNLESVLITEKSTARCFVHNYTLENLEII